MRCWRAVSRRRREVLHDARADRGAGGARRRLVFGLVMSLNVVGAPSKTGQDAETPCRLPQFGIAEFGAHGVDPTRPAQLRSGAAPVRPGHRRRERSSHYARRATRAGRRAFRAGLRRAAGRATCNQRLVRRRRDGAGARWPTISKRSSSTLRDSRRGVQQHGCAVARRRRQSQCALRVSQGGARRFAVAISRREARS